jgi:hypothetical protein
MLEELFYQLVRAFAAWFSVYLFHSAGREGAKYFLQRQEYQEKLTYKIKLFCESLMVPGVFTLLFSGGDSLANLLYYLCLFCIPAIVGFYGVYKVAAYEFYRKTEKLP